MNLINKLFEKRGIKPEELSKEEKDTIEQWQKILSEETITLESVLEFCENQVGNIERQFKDLDSSKNKIEKLVLLHSVYASLRELIKSPKAQRESLVKYLTSSL